MCFQSYALVNDTYGMRSSDWPSSPHLVHWECGEQSDSSHVSLSPGRQTQIVMTTTTNCRRARLSVEEKLTVMGGMGQRLSRLR